MAPETPSVAPETPSMAPVSERLEKGKGSWRVPAKPVVRNGWKCPIHPLEPHSTPLSPSQEIGDVENWARSIEMDMRTIATALEYVYKGQLQSAPS